MLERNGMKSATRLGPWLVLALVAAVSAVGAEDTTLLRRVEILEREVGTLRTQVTALRQAVIVSGANVELKAAGTLTLTGASINANAGAALALRGATASLDGGVLRLNGGATPVLHGTGVICQTPIGEIGGGPCTVLPSGFSPTVLVP
jgi:hypothetical protein